MKLMILSRLLIAFTMVSLSTAATAAHHETDEHSTTALEDTMDELGGAFKKLARAMRAPKAADVGTYQAQAATIKKQAIKAKDMVPMLAEESGDQKEAMIAAYRKSMVEFVNLAENLEIVLARGDLVKAQTVVSKMNEARKKGHEEFKKPDED